MINQTEKYAQLRITKSDEEEENEERDMIEEKYQPQTSNQNKVQIVPDFINYFGELGGFDLIKSYLTSIINYPQGSQSTFDVYNNLPPFQILGLLFQILNSSFQFMKYDLKEEFGNLIEQAIRKRFALITEKEIKDLDHEMIISLLNDTNACLLNILSKEEVYSLTENLELHLALTFLRSPFFEKKLKGIHEIKEMVFKIDYHDITSRGYDKNMGIKTKYIFIHQ